MKKHIAVTIFIIALITIAIVVYADDPNTISVPDPAPDIGWHSSIVLDTSGNPVVSYYDRDNNNLKLLHCNDPACLGNDESITSPDASGEVGGHTSLVLDAAGNPVISYHYGFSEFDLVVMHCNDPNCEGGNESITTPDTAGTVGMWTSLALDNSGNPVISYYHFDSADLKILHCNDPNCEGNNESITSPDTNGDVGNFTSLTLDNAGNPVVSYYDATQDNLKIMHCNDADCAGNNEIINTPDMAGDVGLWTSLQLDSLGNPVVSYFDQTNENLKVLHCNDPDCAGDNESIISPDTVGDVGRYNSLELDSAGNPVVSYFDGDINFDLKVIHCNDPNCAGGDDNITSPDTDVFVGLFTSLVLNENDHPIVSYYDLDNLSLRLLHCGSPTCNTVPTADAGGPYQVDEGGTIMLDGSGSVDAEQDNSTLLYAWDFDEDGQFDDATGIQPDFSAVGLDGPDSILIGLQVTDEGGLTDEDFAVLTVNNVPPLVDAGEDRTVNVGAAILFTGVFTDPGTPDTHTIIWDFGDGTTAINTLTPTHVYAANGIYTVTLTITDDDGGTGVDALTVNVEDAYTFLPVVLKP